MPNAFEVAETGTPSGPQGGKYSALVPDWMMRAVLEEQHRFTEQLFRPRIEPLPMPDFPMRCLYAETVVRLRSDILAAYRVPAHLLGSSESPKIRNRKESFESWRKRTAALIEEQRARHK